MNGRTSDAAKRPFTWVPGHEDVPIGREESDFKFEPKTGSCPLSPGSCIEGEIIFKVAVPALIGGIWFQVDGVVSSVKESDGGSFDAAAKTATFFQTSPILLVGKQLFSRNAVIPISVPLSPGEYKYPVKSGPIRQNLQLPASFHSSLTGSVQYRNLLWVKYQDLDHRWWRYAVFQSFQFPGHFDLKSEPKHLKPVCLTRQIDDGAFFLPKIYVAARLLLPKSGYIPGESIYGTLVVENLFNVSVGELRVRFLQKMAHAESNLRKLKTFTLTEETWKPQKAELDCLWEFEVKLPGDLMPTYRKVRHVLDIFYTIQFFVHISGSSEEVKGETEIVIGTSVTAADSSDSRSVSSNSAATTASDRTSEPSNLTRNIHLSTSTISLPPAYSTLSSRRSSLSTLGNLGAVVRPVSMARFRARTSPIYQVEALEPPACPYVLRSIEMENDMSCFKYKDVLEGKITLEILSPTDFTGMWLQLEGTAIARVTSPPTESVLTAEDKEARFLTLDAPLIAKGNPSKAPPTLTLQTEHVKPGELIIPFKMEVTEKTLPASFDLEFNLSIEYRMAVYCEFYEGKACWRYSNTLETFEYNGYVDIRSEPKLLQPIKVNRGGSFFKNKRPTLQVTVNKRAYVPGEALEGIFEVQNPTGEVLKDAQVTLVRKIMHAEAYTRRLKMLAVGEERLELDESNQTGDIGWEFSLQLAKDDGRLLPTYRKVRHVMDIFYVLQFSVRTEVEELRGDVEIVIGTEGSAEAPSAPAKAIEAPSTSVAATASKLNSASLEDSASHRSLPPSYSCLSSRRPSISSGPPAYSTAWEKVDKTAKS